MSTIPVAVIGCGTIANSAHIPSYVKDPRAKITWFCDIIPERAEAARDAYGSGKVTTDYREVLQDPDVKAVSVCTPNNVHAEITIAALEAGKDVLCEKPAARTCAEAEQMLAAKKRTGRTLNIGVVNRFNEAVNQIKERIDAGELGTVHHVYVSFRAHRSIPGIGGAFTTHAIAGGGALIDGASTTSTSSCTASATPKRRRSAPKPSRSSAVTFRTTSTSPCGPRTPPT